MTSASQRTTRHARRVQCEPAAMRPEITSFNQPTSANRFVTTIQELTQSHWGKLKKFRKPQASHQIRTFEKQTSNLRSTKNSTPNDTRSTHAKNLKPNKFNTSHCTQTPISTALDLRALVAKRRSSALRLRVSDAPRNHSNN